jgi:pyruvate ferredoxin oxidoreductase gamma subunit
VIRVDAQRIAVEERSRPNAVLIGTLTAALPFLDSEIVLEALSDEFARKRPEAVGSTVWNDLSASRTGWLPVLDLDKCIHCGMCDMVCPDLCLVWSFEGNAPVPTAARLVGIDYRYCKGCVRCVESCSTGALTREAETPDLAERLQVPLFPQLFEVDRK